MGKTKYYTGQLLRNRSTREIHFIKHISTKNNIVNFCIYTVPPISKAGQTVWTPNEVVKAWVISKSQMTKYFQVLNKKEAEPILQTMRLLYEQA